MRHRTFFWFILPSLAAMILFIALPIVSVFVQSLYVKPPQVIVTTQNCGPFGCTTSTAVDAAASARADAEHPLGIFNGFGTYLDQNHLAVRVVRGAWHTEPDFGAFVSRVMGLPFYRALAFTLTYTFVVTPFVIILGLAIALAVNAIPRMFRGPTIFASLLPMIVTPLVGSLILFWMLAPEGIVGATLQRLSGDPSLSLLASPSLTWLVLIIYGIWSAAPFAFIVFYAGLQTVPAETLEAAMTDGANRWQRVRYVVVPYIMPLAIFITLIQLMDNFRVFEPIVGFSAGANASSLSWNIYDDLHNANPRFASAAATSMMTILGVAVLLTPVLIRTWHDFNRRRA